jgi:hypothetical protein
MLRVALDIMWVEKESANHDETFLVPGAGLEPARELPPRGF